MVYKKYIGLLFTTISTTDDVERTVMILHLVNDIAFNVSLPYSRVLYDSWFLTFFSALMNCLNFSLFYIIVLFSLPKWRIKDSYIKKMVKFIIFWIGSFMDRRSLRATMTRSIRALTFASHNYLHVSKSQITWHYLAHIPEEKSWDENRFKILFSTKNTV